MDIWKIGEAALGVYLMLPGPEDAATGGVSLAPSALVGAGLVLHAFGAKLPSF